MVCGNRGNPNANTAGRNIGTLPNLAEERASVLIETQFVHQGWLPHRCEVDKASFERVRARTTENCIRRNDGLNDIVGAPGPKLETTEVVRIAHIGLNFVSSGECWSSIATNLSIFANGYSETRNTICSLEDGWIKQSNTARTKVTITSVHANVLIRFEVVLQTQLTISADAKIGDHLVQC